MLLPRAPFLPPFPQSFAMPVPARPLSSLPAFKFLVVVLAIVDLSGRFSLVSPHLGALIRLFLHAERQVRSLYALALALAILLFSAGAPPPSSIVVLALAVGVVYRGLLGRALAALALVPVIRWSPPLLLPRQFSPASSSFPAVLCSSMLV